MTVNQVLEFWSFVFLGVLVYAMGLQFRTLFPTIAKNAWYTRTVVFHAPVVATVIACVPYFPMPESLGGDIGTRVLYGAVCGISCSWLYKAFMRLLGKDTKSASEVVEP